MNRRDRLMATLRGGTVDRPAVSFYEINGTEDMGDDDPFNIYSHPSWRPLVELARDKTDCIVMVGLGGLAPGSDIFPPYGCAEVETRIENGSRVTLERVRASGRVLTSRRRRFSGSTSIVTTLQWSRPSKSMAVTLESTRMET